MNQMVRVKEEDVYAALIKYAGKGELFKIGKSEIQVSLRPQDTHIGDSPDFILWLEVSLKVFEQNLRVKVPIPVEAEVGGIDKALEDLDKFVKRGHHPLEIPMLVVATKGFRSSEQHEKLPVHFMIKQIPERLLDY